MNVAILQGCSTIQMQEIKQLWRINAATLGFFPTGAFEEYAAKGCIIVATDERGALAGYLLFRRSCERLAIVHLCVQEEMQKRGVARILFNRLLDESKTFRGINVVCRRDFSASAIWPKLGFVALGEKCGRGMKSTILTKWFFDCGNPDLFSGAGRPEQEEKLTAAIDANIFYDLDSIVAPDTEESKALMADWLLSSVEIKITPETFNEINRNRNQSQRLRNRQRVKHFAVVRCAYDKFAAAEQRLKPYCPKALSESDRSDIRQLAWTIASGCRYFVTRDENVLSLSTLLDREFGMSVIRPSDLITQLDELQERTKYNPARIAGVLTLRRLQLALTDRFCHAFQASEQKETKAKFRERLHKYLAMPKACDCWGLFWDDEKAAALFVLDRSNEGELAVPFLRIPHGPEVITIVRNLLFRLMQEAAAGNCSRICIIDPYCSALVKRELSNDGFIQETEHWLKHTMPVTLTAESFTDTLGSIRSERDTETMSEAIRSDPRIAQRLERLYWPLKIVDASLPNYIIPIQRLWAAELFDDKLANQDLYGARTKLSLNRQGIYYRSSAPTGNLRAPGRILWYVSEDKKYQGTKCIRACSFLDEVVTGDPKALFRRFARLGVYEWKHLIALAKGKVDNTLMAIRFSDTQSMPNPIIWKSFHKVLLESGIRTQLQSPQSIPSRVFAKLYSMGMGYQNTL